MDCAVHGILQARILEWVAFPFPKGSSQPRDRTQVSCTAGRFFTSWAIEEAWLFLKDFWNTLNTFEYLEYFKFNFEINLNIYLIRYLIILNLNIFYFFSSTT